jgi:glutaredoxin
MYTIWGRPNCVWCDKAKKLMAYNFAEYEYKELTPETLEEFTKVTNGAKTVPQVFFYERLLGGYEELYHWFNGGKPDWVKKNPK